MPRPTRRQKVDWFLGGLLLLLGGLYGIFGCVLFFAIAGDVSFTYLIPFPFGAALSGYVLIVKSIIVKSARK